VNQQLAYVDAYMYKTCRKYVKQKLNYHVCANVFFAELISFTFGFTYGFALGSNTSIKKQPLA
jgi:hypothetical protein